MNARDFLDQLKKNLDISYDKQLAEILGTSKEALDKWIVRDKIPDKIINKIGQNVIGNNNISVTGKNNSISSVSSGVANDEIDEIASLLREYASPKFIKDLREKLLQIKALHG